MVFDVHNFLPGWFDADTFVLLVQSKTYEKATLVVNYADLYVELEICETLKCVVVCKLKRSTPHMHQADKIRFALHDIPSVAIASHWY